MERMDSTDSIDFSSYTSIWLIPIGLLFAESIILYYIYTTGIVVYCKVKPPAHSLFVIQQVSKLES